MKPLVSVIITTYNYGCFIDEAIRSVLNQDFPKEQIEIIVVDDGSTDDTKERIKKYEGKIKYIYQENKGQAGAFNTGFAVAKGEIICLLDADDWWLPKKIKVVVEKFSQNKEIGMVQHFMQEVDIAGNPIKNDFEPRKEYYDLNDFLYGNVSFTGTSGLSFRKKYLEKILPVPEELFYCADEYLYSNIIFYSKVYSINKILGYKKIHGKNWYAGTISNINRLKNHVKVRKCILTVLENRLRQNNIDITETKVYLPLDLLKEEVLLYSKLGEKKKAMKTLLEYFRGYKLRRNLLFTYTSLILAILSANLYLKLYNFYSGNPVFYQIKRFIFAR
jgi:glycosyltransferase involved in cell wall biosynthesis